MNNTIEFWDSMDRLTHHEKWKEFAEYLKECAAIDTRRAASSPDPIAGRLAAGATRLLDVVDMMASAAERRDDLRAEAKRAEAENLQERRMNVQEEAAPAE